MCNTSHTPQKPRGRQCVTLTQQSVLITRTLTFKNWMIMDIMNYVLIERSTDTKYQVLALVLAGCSVNARETRCSFLRAHHLEGVQRVETGEHPYTCNGKGQHTGRWLFCGEGKARGLSTWNRTQEKFTCIYPLISHKLTELRKTCLPRIYSSCGKSKERILCTRLQVRKILVLVI